MSVTNEAPEKASILPTNLIRSDMSSSLLEYRAASLMYDQPDQA